ncbi:MAG: MalY/PatB family protein [Bacteroidales bacterium]|nr:MalY/PatB family protein [Bacteroidales bacterium]
MSKFNFEEKINRRGTACVKHDGVFQAFGLEKTDDAMPMWVADMDFRSPRFVMDAIRQRANHEVLGYTYANAAYWKAVLWWLSHRYGIAAHHDELHFVPGIVAGISFVLQAFTNIGDGVLVTTPVYPPFIDIPRSSGRRLECSGLVENAGRFTLDFDDFERKAARCRLFIFSNPHNPGGTVWRREELLRISEICDKHGLLVIADEIHADLTFPGFHHVSYSTVSSAARSHSVTFIAPSKTFNIAGLGSSVCYCPDPDLRKRFFEGYLETYKVAEGNVFAYTGAAAAFTPEGEEWLDGLLEYLQESVHYMRQYCGQHLPRVRVLYPEASFLAWMDFGGYGLPHSEMRNLLYRKAKVILNDGADFAPDGENDSLCANHFRLNFGCPQSVLVEALERIKTALK